MLNAKSNSNSTVKTPYRATLTGRHGLVLRGYLSDCVPLVIADAQRVVVTSQSQQVLSAPAATGDLLCMFAWHHFKKGGNSQPGTSFTPHVLQVPIFILTKHRNLAWRLPIVNQQVSFDCSYCQQRTGLWPQKEGHLIFTGTNREFYSDELNRSYSMSYFF